MIIPYKAEVPPGKMPFCNWAIIGGIIVTFLLMPDIYSARAERFILDWSVSGVVGHMWLHSGLFHVGINVFFIWVFGNAVCGKVGNPIYLVIYIGGGIGAAMAYLLVDGRPLVGASGALWVVIGVFTVLFPYNYVRCLALVAPVRARAGWLFGYLVFLNAMAGVLEDSSVAYAAHVGGFAVGVVFAIILVRTRLVIRDDPGKVLAETLKESL